LVRHLCEAGKPAAVVCPGRWLLVEAGLVSGRQPDDLPPSRATLTQVFAKQAA
jgi:putative intracellular protease/amidase